ncbi:kinase-like domain-containing protein [Leptodontidium sp. MPI-SDFR-AT-0119]|nr:kinase-like domain-containing protein [Leptodontidium sp. MPI-SDFR-AT-0119]
MQRLTLEAIRNFNLGSSDIIECCIHPNRQIIGGQPQGSLVIKLSDEIVVKFGAGVSVEEADNQRKAYELLDGGVVRVPRVVRYFTRTFDHTSLPIEYLVMEYIYGDILELLGSHLVDQIVKILSHFSTIRSLRPGLLQTGVSRGLLWDSNGKPTFKIIKEMEHWLNFRLPDVKAKLAVEKYPLVLCHLDLALRNIIWLEDGSICLLDWSSAGFYPRFFEICLLKVMTGSYNDYETTLRGRLDQLTDDEEDQVSLLERSFYNGIRYHFPKCRDATFSGSS